MNGSADSDIDLVSSTNLDTPTLDQIRNCLATIAQVVAAQSLSPLDLIKSVSATAQVSEQLVRMAIQYGLDKGSLELKPDSTVSAMQQEKVPA